jgi:hypothetical protein
MHIRSIPDFVHGSDKLLKELHFCTQQQCSSSQGIMHKDQQVPGFYSMVYNLSDTDGGTEIQGEFYPGAEGSAIVFPSELDHKGFGPKIQPNRFVLNCIFSVETPINNAIKGA